MFWLLLAVLVAQTLLGLVGVLVLRRCVLLVYQRLDRLPPRVVARTIYGDEFYRKD